MPYRQFCTCDFHPSISSPPSLKDFFAVAPGSLCNSQGSEVEPPRLVDAVEGEDEEGAVRHRVPELGDVVRDLKNDSSMHRVVKAWLLLSAHYSIRSAGCSSVFDNDILLQVRYSKVWK